MSKLKAEFEQFVKGKHPMFEFRPQQKRLFFATLKDTVKDPNGNFYWKAQPV